MKPSRDIGRLIEIMAALRTPGTGCPWDLEQTFRTIAPYTIEEAYEVADAIARGDLDDLRDELGDLLLQVVFHARMAAGARRLRFRRRGRGDHREADPPPSACLWRRAKATTARRSRACGSASRREEKATEQTARRAADDGALAGVPVALPALTRALKLQNKAGNVGFDWNDPRAVLAQNPRGSRRDRSRARSADNAERRGRSRRSAVRRGQSRPPLCAPIRKTLLRQTNLKFERRFAARSRRRLAARGKTPQDATLAEMDALWDAAKAARKARIGSWPRILVPAPASAFVGVGPHGHAPVRPSSRMHRFATALRRGGRASSSRRRRPDRATVRESARLSASRASIAASSASIPSPLSADTSTGRASAGCRSARLTSRARASASSRSILFQTSISRADRSAVDAELAQHLLDVVRLRLGVLVRHVAHVQDDVGLDHLFQRGAERRHQHGRQIGDEADGIGQDDARCRAAARPRAASDRASQTACRPTARSPRVMRLNSVDLPALV